jgi:UDP-N-acetylmuramoylalanine-D-glutamate ligase
LTVPHPSPTLREALLYAEEWLKQQRSTEDAAAAEPASATVATVKSLLRGRTLVVLGGIRKQHAVERLKQAFDLSEVRWLHASTGLMGHKHSRVHGYCAELGIPCVQTRCASGYSVNMIAEVIMNQASDQLQAARSA